MQPRRATGAVHHHRGTSEMAARDCPQRRMSSICFISLENNAGFKHGATGNAARSQGDSLAIPWFWERERDSVSCPR